MGDVLVSASSPLAHLRRHHCLRACCCYFASSSLGRHAVFITHNIPSFCLERVILISQFKDFAMLSTSLITSALSLTISLPSGLSMRSTSAINGNTLHLKGKGKTSITDQENIKGEYKTWAATLFKDCKGKTKCLDQPLVMISARK